MAAAEAWKSIDHVDQISQEKKKKAGTDKAEKENFAHMWVLNTIAYLQYSQKSTVLC